MPRIRLSIFTGHKGGRVNIHCRSNHTPDIDFGILTKNNSIIINKYHLAIGIDRSIDHRLGRTINDV